VMMIARTPSLNASSLFLPTSCLVSANRLLTKSIG
jgi:hypothetical protein